MNNYMKIYLLLFCASVLNAACSLDHVIIGVNEDGISGTSDDDVLFVDCSQKYRNAANSNADWYYPLSSSIYSSYKYRIGEPGFDCFQSGDEDAGYTYDPNRALSGQPTVDYNLVIECVSLASGFRAVYKDYPQFTIDAEGQSFDYSSIHYQHDDAHMHMSYQGVESGNLYWVSWKITDTTGAYEDSQVFTFVFNVQPELGDIYIDGLVDIKDLESFLLSWLNSDGSKANDFYERADIDRSGQVDIIDFAILADNWMNNSIIN